jgi:hypothetical protein
MVYCFVMSFGWIVLHVLEYAPLLATLFCLLVYLPFECRFAGVIVNLGTLVSSGTSEVRCPLYCLVVLLVYLFGFWFVYWVALFV